MCASCGACLSRVCSVYVLLMVPKAFLMSVKMKVCCGSCCVSSRSMNNILSTPAVKPMPNWWGESCFMDWCVYVSKSEPVAILKRQSNKTIGRTPPCGLESGRQRHVL